MATTKEDRSFKQLINKRVTSSAKQFYEEIGDETLIITNAQIWADEVADNDPGAAIIAGAVEFRSKLVLTEDVTVANQQSWFAEDGYRLKDWVSDRFGSDYTAKLFDNNDSEIFPTDALDWFFDYPTGILTISGDASAFTQPFKLDGYRYVGTKGIASSVPTSTRFSVADQTARLALSPSEGDLAYQEDIQVTYQYRDDGGGVRWRVVDLPALDDIYFGGFPAIYYHVDPAGDDSNDGRDLGASRAKETLGAVFEELNDAGFVRNGHGTGFFPPFVEIRMAPGAYTQTGFQDLVLTAKIPGHLYIVPQFGDYVNNETITVSTDNGLIAGSATERDLSTNAFTTFAGRGERFIWTSDITPNGDVFPGNLNRGNIRPSTSGSLRILSPTAPGLTTFFLSQYETTLDCLSIESRDPQTSIFIYGLEIDNSTTTLITYRNVTLQSCRVTSTGGSSVLFLKGDSPFRQLVSCYLDLPAQVNAHGDPSQGDFQSIFNCDIDEGRFDIYSGTWSVSGNRWDVSPRWGSFTPSQSSIVAGSISSEDYLGTSGPQFNGFANVRQLGDLYMPNVTTSTCLRFRENARFTRQVGDLFAANAGLTGPAITVDSGAQALGVSGYTGITTTPAGQDIRVGARATSALSTLPRTDYSMGDLSQGVRAT